MVMPFLGISESGAKLAEKGGVQASIFVGALSASACHTAGEQLMQGVVLSMLFRRWTRKLKGSEKRLL